MSASPFDLPAYLKRIGFDQRAPLAPTLDVLRALVTHHARMLPFENIEVLAGRVPKLDLDSLQDKLIGRGRSAGGSDRGPNIGRGGYCFEHNSLFMAALGHIGFTVRAREARVRAGVPADVATPRTHMALQVSVAGGEYLVDVGFGGLAPLAPLALHTAAEQVAGSGRYRLIEQPDGDLLMQTLLHEGWSDCYEVGPGRPRQIDFVMGNWFVATHPSGFLRNNLLLGRAQPRGGRLTLFNDTLTLRSPQTAAPEERRLHTHAEFADVLAGGFGLRLDAADLDAVVATAQRQAATAPPA